MGVAAAKGGGAVAAMEAKGGGVVAAGSREWYKLLPGGMTVEVRVRARARVRVRVRVSFRARGRVGCGNYCS